MDFLHNLITSNHHILYGLVVFAWSVALAATVFRLIPGTAIKTATRYGKITDDPAFGNPDKRNKPLSVGLPTHRFAFTSSYVLAAGLNLLFFAITALWVVPTSLSFTYLAVVVLLEAHLLRRVYECLTVHRFSVRPLSIPNLLLMWMFYIWLPAGLSVEFWHLALNTAPDLPDSTPDSSYFGGRLTRNLVFGLLLFAVGTFEQGRAHRTLAALRKSPDAPKFGIPRGGMFEFIWSPHYLAEILIYVGLLLISEFDFVSLWLVAAFVVVTMAAQASDGSEWYRTNPYVKNDKKLVARKALLPFLW